MAAAAAAVPEADPDPPSFFMSARALSGIRWKVEKGNLNSLSASERSLIAVYHSIADDWGYQVNTEEALPGGVIPSQTPEGALVDHDSETSGYGAHYEIITSCSDVVFRLIQRIHRGQSDPYLYADVYCKFGQLRNCLALYTNDAASRVPSLRVMLVRFLKFRSIKSKLVALAHVLSPGESATPMFMSIVYAANILLALAEGDLATSTLMLNGYMNRPQVRFP